MNAYCTEVRKLEVHFEGLEFHHVCRDNNVAADVLSKLGSKRVLVPTSVFVQDLRKPSIRLLSDLELYRRSASNGILMKCILRSKGLQLLQEIHGGECGNHVASANLVGKAFRSGFYWPTAMADAQDLVRRCKGCQFFAKQQHMPAQALRTIPPS
jgi:hypothetical protein